MKLGEFLADVGRSIAYSPSIARLIGVKETIFLCQLIYWRDKSLDGWVYKTQEEFTEETGLSRPEQETTRKNLKKAGLLQERHERLLHRMYYRANIDKLGELWEARPNAGTQLSRMLEPSNGDGDFPAFGTAGFPLSSLDTKITSEITTQEPVRAIRLRNPLFDALCEVEHSDADEAAKQNGGKIAKALSQIKRMTPEVTAEEIKRRATNYRQSWPNITCSATALSNHWAKFGSVQLNLLHKAAIPGGRPPSAPIMR